MRFLSYNVKSGLQAGIRPLVEAIAATDADVVGLQEVDRGTRRSGGSDQAREIAAEAGYGHAHFGVAVPWEGGGEYGVALLSRHPVRDVAQHALFVPSGPEVPTGAREPRVMLSATVDAPGDLAVRVFVTHLGLEPEQRNIQSRELAAAVWQATVHSPVVLLGDLNAGPDARELLPLLGVLKDAHAAVPRAERTTFPANSGPADGIIVDYVLVSPDVGIDAARVVKDARNASDHDLCVADLSFAPGGRAPTGRGR